MKVEAEIFLDENQAAENVSHSPRLNGVGWPTVLPTVEGTGELVESDTPAGAPPANLLSPPPPKLEPVLSPCLLARVLGTAEPPPN